MSDGEIMLIAFMAWAAIIIAAVIGIIYGLKTGKLKTPPPGEVSHSDDNYRIDYKMPEPCGSYDFPLVF